MAKKRAPVKSASTRAKATRTRRVADTPTELARAAAGVVFPVVVVGASAGGLEAFTALLKGLPSRSGMAFVLIQHLEPDHESALARLLGKATSMPVAEVSDGLAVEPNHVYVIPPNKNLTIRKGTLRLTPRTMASGLHHPIDVFAAALAEEQGNAAIGVVLSGTGSDGTLGLKAIKAAGGITFAQDPKTAGWPGMPISAIMASSVDFVLSPKRIATELARIGRHPYLAQAREVPEGDDLDKICQILRSATGVDFRLYKQATFRRRMARRMALQKIGSLNKYAQVLKRDPEEAKALADDIFIHVTGFFRDPECFQALRKLIFAKLLLKKPAGEAIRIWVAGCSTGEEAYSIAMMLFEHLGEHAHRTKIQIFGTDIQERAVEHARAGIYTEAAVAGVLPSRLKRFFDKADQGYQVNKLLRDVCVFARHDLAKDPPFSKLDLVSCRNVLIYMEPGLQKRVLSVFQYALKPGGYLFLGNSESISESSPFFTPEDRKHRIFSRKLIPASPHYLIYPMGALREPPAAAQSISKPSLAFDFRKEAERALLEHYMPPALVVDRDLHIVHFQGDTSPYLAPATGQPSFHLLKMVRPEFVVDLRTAVQKARKDGVAVQRDGVHFEYKGRPATVRLEVRPLQKGKGKKSDFLVVFQGVEVEQQADGGGEHKAHPTKKVAGLERELASAREHLYSLIEEHEAAQEEMKAANQEVLSSNEELQSTNEELETAKEELQSSNEELVTLNEELQHSNTELNVLSRDLSNLLVGVDIPVLVLDAHLCVRRFTPVAGALLNLIPGDVGRPFRQIASNLDVADWNKLFSEVTGSGRSVEREVSDRNAHRYSLRVRPYMTSDNKLEGVLMVLLDTNLIQRARDESTDYARAIVESIHEALAVVDSEFQVLAVNRSFCELFRVSLQDMKGQSFFGPGKGQIDVPRLRKLLKEVLSKRTEIKDFELDRQFPEIGHRRLALEARQIEKSKTILIAIEDLTERKHEQEELARGESTIRALLESTTQSIIAVNTDGVIQLANGTTEKMFGYKAEKLLGQPLHLLIPENLRERHAKHHRTYFKNMESRPMGVGLEPSGRRKDGTVFPVEIGLSVIDSEAGKLAVAYVSDITERKRIEDLLLQRENELDTLLNNAPDVIVRFDRDVHYTYVNASAEKEIGLQKETMVGKTPRELGIPKAPADVVTRAVRSVFRTGQPEVNEFSYPSPGGTTSWEARFIPEFGENGAVRSVLNVARDFTERRQMEHTAQAHAREVQALAASLLTAQEEERRRVSRELHDQICQQLASLAMDIGGLSTDPPPPEDAPSRLTALQARVVKTSEQARHLAYELHPSVLDDLGLVASLRALCKEFSEREGVPVEITSGVTPGSIPREVASCLYRVTHESLQNVAKHSRAKHVAVALGFREGTVTLSIKDDGVGFDHEAVKGRGGLGLISMEERARLVKGKLSVVSQPGRGTRIALEIPLPRGSL